MKTTPLYDTHKALGAKMVPFAGYSMPLAYESIALEHQTVRKAVGIFDVSHMGEFLIEGPNALQLLQKVTSNDVSTLTIGQAQYSCLPNQTGGIVDDLLVYRVKEQTYLLVVNAATAEKDWNHIAAYNKTIGATMRNLSDAYALLAIQGPKAIETLQPLTSVTLSSIPSYHFVVGDLAGISHVILSATGYTGAGGFEVYCKNTEVQAIWDEVMKVGVPFGIKPIGLAARDTLRLEMGYCLYGNDIDETTSPLEAGLGRITKFTKDFVNSTALAQEKDKGPQRKLVAFQLEERGIPRQGYPILDKNGHEIGKVTSGTLSPSLSKGIGLGYVPTAHSKKGHTIYIAIRNKTIAATVVKPPFYKNA